MPRNIANFKAFENAMTLDIAQRLRRAGVDVYEADIRPPGRFLMERFITAPVSFGGRAQGRAAVGGAAQTPP